MLVKTLTVLSISVALLTGADSATASEASGLFMVAGGNTRQPSGHAEFCSHHASECRVVSATPSRVRVTAQSWNELVAINAMVNRTVFPATDVEVYGREEWWAYPTQEGDCEDVVLLKRRHLIERGWPVSALLITVVKRPTGEGHAVLTVLTDRGDMVLDNFDDRVGLWSETPYSFVKRQSEHNSGQWTAIQDTRLRQVGSTR